MNNKKYLISCCKVKTKGGDQQGSISDLLFSGSVPELLDMREYILKLYMNKGKEHIRTTHKGPVAITSYSIFWDECLPANVRYSGRLYSKIDPGAWEAKGNSSVYILSALFGIIRPVDRIPSYDLKMDDTIGGVRINSIWKESGVLDKAIKLLVNERNAMTVALSGEYKRAFGRFRNLGVTEAPKFPGYGIGTGTWLNEQLNLKSK